MEEERLWDFFIDICIGFWEEFLSSWTDWLPNDEVEECFELHSMLISEFIELYGLVDCTESRLLSCLLLKSDCLRSSTVVATAGGRFGMQRGPRPRWNGRGVRLTWRHHREGGWLSSG